MLLLLKLQRSAIQSSGDINGRNASEQGTLAWDAVQHAMHGKARLKVCSTSCTQQN
jgi:hypothetical protein